MELHNRAKALNVSENEMNNSAISQKNQKEEKKIVLNSQAALSSKNDVNTLNEYKRVSQKNTKANNPPVTPKLAKLQDFLGIVQTHSFNQSVYKTPEAALDAILNSSTKSNHTSYKRKSNEVQEQLNQRSKDSLNEHDLQDIGKEDILKMRYKISEQKKQIGELKSELEMALGLNNELKTQLLESENRCITLKTNLEQASEKLDTIYNEYVPNSDFQQVCIENKKLKEDLIEKEALLKECESVLADLVE
ncbi:hypothetical protein AYI70_g3304 [Smittium culicis]|uniref:Uncharacterized protein n=1 Tax=Smittium culicis TaxID=133412 RepID=A0A1R1XLF4_9FUNG|nr:hypothetical protein AYI70_g7636 [Smittium culicis]OMJ15461.1 hypothetical protein AYI70_g7251 [Smittium culicis]OMJ21717.1 hypothetical protein AYI70_g3304 [Smittium culicis]